MGGRDERRDGEKSSRGASSPRRQRPRSRSRSRDRSGRSHGHGGSPRRSRRSPTPPRHHRRHRSRSRSRDQDRRRRPPSRSASPEMGGYVPRGRRHAGSVGRDNMRFQEGVSMQAPEQLDQQGKGSGPPVDPAIAQAERQRLAQQWVLQQQTSGVAKPKEIIDDGGGGDKKNKEIYVGNLLVGIVTADTLKQLFDSSLAVAFPNQNPLFKPVIHVQMAFDLKYAFIQLRTEEMAAAAIQLSGMELCGRPMTIARPSGWADPSSVAVMEAPDATL